MSKQTVFISHSSLDREIAKFLKDKIVEYTGGTIQIFVSSDGESIPFGKNWLSTIEQGLNDSSIMFLLVTPNSINNLWVSFEAGFGYSKNIRVIPLCFRVSVSDLQYPLGMLQGYDLTSAESFNNILSILNKEFGHSHKLSFTEDDYDKVLSISSLDEASHDFSGIVKDITWAKAFQIIDDKNYEGKNLVLQEKIKAGLLNPTLNFLKREQIQYSVIDEKNEIIKINFAGILLEFSQSEQEQKHKLYYLSIKFILSPYNIHNAVPIIKKYFSEILEYHEVELTFNINQPYNFRTEFQDLSALFNSTKEFLPIAELNAYRWKNYQLTFYKNWDNVLNQDKAFLLLKVNIEEVNMQELQELIGKLVQLDILYFDKSLLPDQVEYRREKKEALNNIEQVINKREREKTIRQKFGLR